MIYIIDANNLAGKMDLLKEKDFDKTLIKLISAYFFNQKNKIYLVFDSADPFGDKYEQGNITVVYAPKNELYATADEKIIELINRKLFEEKVRDEMTLITDDRGIVDEVLEMKDEKNGERVKVISASSFAGRLVEDDESDSDDDLDEMDDRGLGSDKVDKLNEGLLGVWSNR